MTMKTSCVNLVICILYQWIAISCFIFWSHRDCVGNWTVQQCSLLSLREEHWYSLETLHFDIEDKINLWDLSLCIIIYKPNWGGSVPKLATTSPQYTGPEGLSPAFRYRSQPSLLSEYTDSLLWSYQFPAWHPEQAWQFGRLSSSS